jgi:triosephosphate isomerase
MAAHRFIIGNWKMNGLAASLAAIDTVAAELQANPTPVRCAICPPATLIERAVARAGTRLLIGGQDCAATPSGAHTGDIAAEMLKDCGARLVIVGHSERRADHGETDAVVRAKAEAAMRARLTAVVCVGETQAQHDAGEAEAVVGGQLAGSLPEGTAADTVVVAYEPVWAIGTGRVASEADIARMHGFIRDRLLEIFGERGTAIAILYGGSVKPDNAAAILRVREVAGALVGGASLQAKDFLAIAAAARS